jgi:gliding motility-associated-like protein
MRASSGYVSNDLFQCNGGNKITITPSYTPLSAIADTNWGVNQWVAHAYTWTATTGQILNTPALIAQQSFFNQANYKGHFIRNSLSFDINYTLNGSKMPGPINILHDGTSFSCGEGYSVNYSIRFKRKQFFNPGKYRIDIAADDGIRISIDGGQTWLLDGFLEQSYSASYKTTNTQFPDGICLNGEIKLVVEYFQRPVDARVTVSITQLSEIASELNHITLCEDGSAVFSAGNALPGASYFWEYAEDGGNSFQSIVSGSPYSGEFSPVLTVNPASTDQNNNVFRCRIEGVCPNPVYTDTALLKVLNNALITDQPQSLQVCAGDSIRFLVNTDATSMTWEWSNDQGQSYTPLRDSAVFSGITTPQLSVFPADNSWMNVLFRLKIETCSGFTYSDAVSATIEEKALGDIIPNIITPNGDGKNDVFKLREDGVEPLEILLFNRWGQRVYWSDESGTFEWNPLVGSASNSSGVYFYMVRYRLSCGNQEEERQGTLTVLY